MQDNKRRSVKLQEFAAAISRKLALLLGGSLALSSAVPSVIAEAKVPQNQGASRVEGVATAFSKPLPPKLILKQAGSGFKMIAQHDSHSSHSSHASHGSHSSHSSHTSSAM
jgi:hypothetical protein